MMRKNGEPPLMSFWLVIGLTVGFCAAFAVGWYFQ
jgi:hypothetical protein